jgi:hypothetical protein
MLISVVLRLVWVQGNLCFYSLSYDWSRGAENNDPKVTLQSTLRC